MGFWEHTSSETLKWLLCACASGEQQELWHRYKETRCIAHENKRWPKRIGPPSDADWMVWCNLMFPSFYFLNGRCKSIMMNRFLKEEKKKYHDEATFWIRKIKTELRTCGFSFNLGYELFTVIHHGVHPLSLSLQRVYFNNLIITTIRKRAFKSGMFSLKTPVE